MGVILNFDDKIEEVQPGKKITFSKLDFIDDQFRDLCVQEPTPVEEGEQSL